MGARQEVYLSELQEGERMTFRVMCGWSAIWAGNAKELKDGAITMTGVKHNVTEDVLASAAMWLDAHKIEWVAKTGNGRKITLKVEIEEASE